MNSPKSEGRIRTKMPDELLNTALDIYIQNPGIGMEGILRALLKIDKRWAIYLYKHHVNDALTYPEQVRIAKCGTKKEAEELYNKLLRDRSTEYSLDYKMATQIKNLLRRRGHKIYGGLRLGYVHEDSLTSQTAAMWLHQRIRKLEKESDLWRGASKKLSDEAKTTAQKTAAKHVSQFVAESIDGPFLKGVADELELHFIRE